MLQYTEAFKIFPFRIMLTFSDKLFGILFIRILKKLKKDMLFLSSDKPKKFVVKLPCIKKVFPFFTFCYAKII